MKWFVLVAATVVSVVGCHTRGKRTVDEFAFLEIGMPMTVVSNRVGMPDLPYRGQIRWRYGLADGSEMTVVSEGGDTFESWRVRWFGQTRGDKWLWVTPTEALK